MSSCSDSRRCVTFSIRDDAVRTIRSLENVNSGMFTAIPYMRKRFTCAENRIARLSSSIPRIYRFSAY